MGRLVFWIALVIYAALVATPAALGLFDWEMFLLVATPGLILVLIVGHVTWWGRAARRRSLGLCPRCAYDLRGNLDSGCPECGWNRMDEGSLE